MSNLDATEHLKIARRLHFQGLTEEAIKEYELVLEIDPANEDAVSGLRALGVEPPDPSTYRDRAEDPSKIRTGFFVNQARESEASPWKKGPFLVLVIFVGALALFGGYKLVTFMINYDNIKAMNNVDAHISKVKTDAEGKVIADMTVANYNPAPITDMVISYTIHDAAGSKLKDGTLKINIPVPAGDKRTFPALELGTVTGQPEKLEQKLEDLKYGPKPKINEKLVDKYINATMKPDKENFADFDDITQDADNFSPALVGMGRAYAARSDWKRAMEQYKHAIEIDPDNWNAHYHMAMSMFYAGDKTGAKKELEKASTLAPEDPLVTFSLKYMFATEGKGKSGKGKSGKVEGSDKSTAGDTPAGDSDNPADSK